MAGSTDSIADYFAPFNSGAFQTGAGTRNAPKHRFDFNELRRSGAGRTEWNSSPSAANETGQRFDDFSVFKGANGEDLLVEIDHNGNYIVRPNIDMYGQFWGKRQTMMNGQDWDRYSPDMQFIDGGEYRDLKDSTAAPWMGAAMATAGIGAAVGGVGAAAAGAGGAAGGTGGAVGGAGGFIGEGALSGVGAWDAAAAAAPSWTAGGGGLAAGGFVGEGVSSGVPAWDAAAGLGPEGVASTAGVPPPANPYNPASYLDPKNLGNLATNTLTNGSATDLIKPLIGPAVTALTSGGGGDGGLAGMQSDEDKRQAKVREAVDAINRQFGYGTDGVAGANRKVRDAAYGDISGAVRDTALRDLDRQYSQASRRNTFGLARNGLIGGSVDAEAGGDLQERYGEGRMKATQAGQQASSDLRISDERSRQNLIGMAETGMDTGTAASLAAGQMSAATELARSNTSSANVGRLFDDMQQAYIGNQVAKARYPNGLPQQQQPAGYTAPNLWGSSRYTGTVQRS